MEPSKLLSEQGLETKIIKLLLNGRVFYNHEKFPKQENNQATGMHIEKAMIISAIFILIGICEEVS